MPFRSNVCIHENDVRPSVIRFHSGKSHFETWFFYLEHVVASFILPDSFNIGDLASGFILEILAAIGLILLFSGIVFSAVCKEVSGFRADQQQSLNPSRVNFCERVGSFSVWNDYCAFYYLPHNKNKVFH